MAIENPRQSGPVGNLPDEDSGERIGRLLQGARSAAALSHKLALLDIEAEHRLAWHRSHFNPNQPRVPAGHPDGGQWTRTGSAKGSNGPQVMSDVMPSQIRRRDMIFITSSRRPRPKTTAFHNR